MLVPILSLYAACPEPKPTTPDSGVSTDSADTDDDAGALDLQPGQICIPGSVDQCIFEGGTLAKICNASGTGYLEQECPTGGVCIEGDCTECFPGTKSCQGDDVILLCRLDGSGWDPYQNCLTDTGGDVCDPITNECVSLCELNYKFNSYIGCDYWGVDLDNAFVPGGSRGFYDALNAQYAIVVSNPPDSPREAIVEIFQKEVGNKVKVPFDVTGAPLPTEPLEPGELRTYRLPARNVNGTVLAALAYQVVSNVPIIAYQFNPLENENVFSNDASLLLPSNLLGKEYIVMTREQTFDVLRGYLTVVAISEGETKVSVDLTAPTEAGLINPGAPDEQAIRHYEAGESAFFTLQQFDVLNIETDRPGADLTGSLVRSDRRIAVFGGSEAANAPNTARCINIDETTGEGVCEWDESKSCVDLMDCVAAGFNTCCADHLEQQLFPISTWGTQYVAAKSFDRGGERDIWRIVAAQDNTQVVLIPQQAGVSIPVLNRGEWFEFESHSNFEIHASEGKPIMVGQFLAAQDAPDPNVGGIAQPDDAGIGDPAFMLAIPVEQYRNDFVVLVPEEYELNYCNIVAPTGAAVMLNLETVDPAYFDPIGSGTYSVYRELLDPGTHTITSSEPAGVIVYGWDDYVSYGYTGGLSLEELNKGTILPPVGGE